jgi:hypothetical protein
MPQHPWSLDAAGLLERGLCLAAMMGAAGTALMFLRGSRLMRAAFVGLVRQAQIRAHRIEPRRGNNAWRAGAAVGTIGWFAAARYGP